jgi:radical SAM protein with 4Fe4S-binding SPASM domain
MIKAPSHRRWFTLRTFKREAKNFIVSHPLVFNSFIRAINLPVLGHIYDFFYFRRVRKKAHGKVRQLSIEPNNICNLKCIMCPYPDMTRPKETMSMELFKSIIDQSAELGCEEVLLMLYNEPYIDKMLFERIKYVREKGLLCSYYSNGTLLKQNNNIEKTLETPPDLICFSLDGFSKEVMEKIRVNANRDTVYSGINALLEERNRRGLTEPRIEIYFTLTDINRHELKVFRNYWRERADFVSIFPVDGRRSEEFVKLNYKRLKPYPCFNKSELYVHSSGQLALCCFDYNGGMDVGDLKKKPLKEILESPNFTRYLDSHYHRKRDMEVCKNCSKLYIDSAFYWWF